MYRTIYIYIYILCENSEMEGRNILRSYHMTDHNYYD